MLDRFYSAFRRKKSRPQREPQSKLELKDRLGFKPFVQSVVTRLDAQFEQRGDARDNSIVVGLFGQWGSGKTFMLELLHDELAQRSSRATARSGKSLTIPVRFNPWRYEMEEHVVIPLLKTAYQSLVKWRKESGTTDENAWKWVKNRAALLSQSAIALSYGMKGELTVPFLGKISFDPGKALAEEQKRWERQLKKDRSGIEDHQSLYYDLHSNLRVLTGREPTGSERLNFVFLVDDLDRCLPDKAIQVLEAIKLFLEVEGTAFVLALDDEVIERGIAYRYRDYARDGAGRYDALAYSTNPKHFETFKTRRGVERLPPISGPEYLEKIIHLPFRIPLPTVDKVEELLTEDFPRLFQRKSAAEKVRSTPGKKGDAADNKPSRRSEDARKLQELFLKAIPHVPRKLIRCAELLELLGEIARRQGMELDLVTLARLVILQLLAPRIYRFGRQNQGFLATMERWARETDGRWVSDLVLEKMLKDRTDEAKPHGATRDHVVERLEVPLLRRILEAAKNRSGFDARNLIDLGNPSDSPIGPYFSLVREATAAPAPEAEDEEVPRASLRDMDGFLAQLLSDQPDAWLSALGVDELQGRALDQTSFDAMMKRLADNHYEIVATDWLEAVSPHLTVQQMIDLYRESGILKRLSEQAAEEQSTVRSA